MFNPMGMVIGLVLAQQREVEQPLIPAMVAGALPMPMGIVAALLFTERATTGTATAAVAPPEPPRVAIDDRLRVATEGVKAALAALPRVPAAIADAVRRLLGAVAAAWQLPDAERAELTNLAAADRMLKELVPLLGK